MYVSLATDIPPTKSTTAHEQRNQRDQSEATAALSTTDDDTGTQQLAEDTGEMLMRLNTSLRDLHVKAAQDVPVDQHSHQSGREALSPENREEGNVPPFSLIALLALFLFLCVGAEVGFGAWVAVVVLRDGLSGEASAIRMARYGEKQDGNYSLSLKIH